MPQYTYIGVAHCHTERLVPHAPNVWHAKSGTSRDAWRATAALTTRRDPPDPRPARGMMLFSAAKRGGSGVGSADWRAGGLVVQCMVHGGMGEV